MTDFSPYGVTQHADAERTTADALFGERAGSATANAAYGSPATFSTAPYVGPKPKDIAPLKVCFGTPTCRARPMKGTDRCFFHSQKAAG